MPPPLFPSTQHALGLVCLASRRSRVPWWTRSNPTQPARRKRRQHSESCLHEMASHLALPATFVRFPLCGGEHVLYIPAFLMHACFLLISPSFRLFIKTIKPYLIRHPTHSLLLPTRTQHTQHIPLIQLGRENGGGVQWPHCVGEMFARPVRAVVRLLHCRL